MNPSTPPPPAAARVPWPLRWTLLALILALGVWLRFADLRVLVPYMVDDAAYHLEGRYYVEVYEALRDTIALKLQENRTGEDVWKREAEFPKIRAAIEGGGVAGAERIWPFYARPLHSALIAVGLGVLGKDALYAGPAVSAVTGTLTILVLYLLARRMYGDRAGLVAALLGSVGGYLVLYGRNGFSEMNSVLFLVLSMYFYWRSREAWPERRYGWIFLAGVAWGFGCTAQDRWLLMFVLPLAYEAHLWIAERFRNLGRLLFRLVLLGAGLLVPMILFELPYYVGMIAARAAGAVSPIPTYFEQLFGHIRLMIGSDIFGILIGFGWTNLLSYPYLFWVLCGPAIAVLLGLGALSAFRRATFANFFLGLWFWLPVVYYGLTAPRARYASIFLPPAILLASGLFARWTADRRFAIGGRSVPAGAALALVAAAILTGLGPAREVVALERTCYADAFAWIRAHTEPPHRHLSTSPMTSATQLGLESVQPIPRTAEELAARYREGYRYYVLDFKQFYRPAFLQPERDPDPASPFQPWYVIEDLADAVMAAGPPVFECVNPCVDLAGNMFEWNYKYDFTRAFMESPRTLARKVRVYDLERYFGPRAPEDPQTP